MKYLPLFFLLLTLTGRAQHPALLPLPQTLAWTKQAFALTGSIRLNKSSADAQPIADSVAQFIRQVSRATVSQKYIVRIRKKLTYCWSRTAPFVSSPKATL